MIFDKTGDRLCTMRGYAHLFDVTPTGRLHTVSTAKNAKVAADLDTPTDLPKDGVDKVSKALNGLLADAFALYLKTKNFHWHVSGRHFRDYHLMLDEQSDQIFATTDLLAERVRKIGGTTIRSIGGIAKLQTIKDNDEAYVPPREMLRELMNDNKLVCAAMRKAHDVCDDANDVASASLLENFIDETERRTWFLFEASRQEGGNED
jgi:starvation-inducible DNA-binding protein